MQVFRSKFSERIRVSPENNTWLKQHKKKGETAAAFLDSVIN
jgi:hypothetical protein